MTAILPPPPPPPRYRLPQNLTTAWLRLGKAAVIAVLAGIAIAAGLAFPGSDAEAQGFGGYTYSQRVCQEYGQQPRWYNVRDGQAAYNGGNSDSGWLIVLERGSPNFAGWRPGWTRDSSPAGYRIQRRNVPIPADDYRPYIVDWNQDGSISPGNQPVGDYGVDTDNNGVSDAYRTFTPIWSGGGSYVRWAHIAWCR